MSQTLRPICSLGSRPSYWYAPTGSRFRPTDQVRASIQNSRLPPHILYICSYVFVLYKFLSANEEHILYSSTHRPKRHQRWPELLPVLIRFDFWDLLFFWGYHHTKRMVVFFVYEYTFVSWNKIHRDSIVLYIIVYA